MVAVGVRLPKVVTGEIRMWQSCRAFEHLSLFAMSFCHAREVVVECARQDARRRTGGGGRKLEGEPSASFLFS